ncbi:MAG TPA: SRPBCC domain-containing protein [Euzebyales bacterium]|nr:SRPBCC domain-containing protein [Euzebyales bacterium]
MSDPRAPEVTRTVELDATVDEVWTALTDDEERAAWFGGDGWIDVRPGGHGEIRSPDGSLHRVAVDTVEPGRRLGWRWSPEPGGPVSDVEFVVEQVPRGARLTVTERRVEISGTGATGLQASVTPSVTARLLDLELLFLARSRV